MRVPVGLAHGDIGRRRALRSFGTQVTLRFLIGLPAAALLLGPASIAGFRDSSPPIIRNNLDAFLPAIAVTLIVATWAGSVVLAGDAVRAASLEERRSAAWMAMMASAVLGVAVYALAGWGLPLLSQRPAFPAGVSSDQALRAHPFLLTTPELLRVQEAFRGVGGFSRRVALTLELRAWLSAWVPVFTVLAAATMLAARPRSRIGRVLAIEIGALVFFFVALVVSLGPALFLIPNPRPQMLAWGALTLVGVASAWRLRRALYPPETIPSLTLS
jgi:hypothetical protein